MSSLDKLVVALSGPKHVRTPEGSKKYDAPIGALITLHLQAIAHAHDMQQSELDSPGAAKALSSPLENSSAHQAPTMSAMEERMQKRANASAASYRVATGKEAARHSAEAKSSGVSDLANPAQAKATANAPKPSMAHQAPTKPVAGALQGSKSPSNSDLEDPAQAKATMNAPKPSSAHEAPKSVIGKLADKMPKGEAGTKQNPIKTSDVNEAAAALGKGQFVELSSRHEVSTLIDKLAELVNDAKTKGDKAPDYDLCKVTVPGTNLFCAESKGVPRTMMPQLKGIPIKGSQADKLPKNDKGEVDLGPEFVKWLKEKKNIAVKDDNINASHLKASQVQLNGGKVAGMSKAMLAGKVPAEPIFVTNDDYIVDGHHRWAANVANEITTGKDIVMPTYQIDENIIPVLAYANFFSKHMGIPQAGVGAASPVSAPKSNIEKLKAGVKGTAAEQQTAKRKA